MSPAAFAKAFLRDVTHKDTTNQRKKKEAGILPATFMVV
jgi:hypothetical protein